MADGSAFVKNHVLLYQLDSSDGTHVKQKSTAGAAHTNQQGGVWDYGTWPSSYYSNSSVTQAATASGTVVYTSSDLSMYNGFVVEVSAIGGTSPVLNAFPTIDGTNYAATACGWVNLQTGATISGATGLTAVGIYALIVPASTKVKFKGLKMTITGGAADLTCTFRYAHVWG